MLQHIVLKTSENKFVSIGLLDICWNQFSVANHGGGVVGKGELVGGVGVVAVQGLLHDQQAGVKLVAASHAEPELLVHVDGGLEMAVLGSAEKCFGD